MEEVTFEIETQAAAAITNIGGDQTVYAGERRSRVPRLVSVFGLLLSLTGLGLLVLTGMRTADTLLASNFWPSDPGVLHRRRRRHVADGRDPGRRRHRPLEGRARPREALMANFNIGQQNAASIQNIGGDAVIEGGIHATATWEVVELRRVITRAQEGVAALNLPPPTREAVNQSLDAAAREAAHPKPNRHDVAEHLGNAARTLKEAGALVGAGTAVLESLHRAAGLLGPVGAALISAV